MSFVSSFRGAHALPAAGGGNARAGSVPNSRSIGEEEGGMQQPSSGGGCAALVVGAAWVLPLVSLI
ncbi:hypothetical protein [Trinickia soli]|uniref:hypothetical protein n=1 Tax=Trinickia soli TaxID=380675 RepID=UPI001251DCEE|nr:hypothetical protein CIW54_27670 [Paraburkholderia sp. T12-10]